MSVQKYSEQKQINAATYQASIVIDYFNRRLRVLEYRGNLFSLIDEVYEIAVQHSFEKIIYMAKREDLHCLMAQGYMIEAMISKYFNGSDAYFVTKYFTNERRNSEKWMEEEKIITDILRNPQENKQTDTDFLIRKATPKDAGQLAALYNTVFQIYPTPLNNPDYIQQVMKESTIFYVVEDNGTIISVASAEVNRAFYNAELTDCATLDAYRKHGLMKKLLVQLEKELISNGIYCAYSIARALSYGMNKSFCQLGYTYTGRLTNNCYIFDKIEDMNVWVRDLTEK
ncbi:putative beta-lysine N-acetyltransferase [Bacillus timonensis]|uniref:Putative beta-lysine N-acetyltransferase n=1 Tax=Bacillus timonensis TaxID=1033734 RepID=A0A4S3PV50_9BACI|nr:putative beta-lysine N-acetyltransferase [Bacillus timonensis]THE13687.1 putative beta-lysine N-acetyltransferase [Bacillus timonensis]